MCPLLALLDPSPATLLILGAIAVLLFGERLPEVAKSVGKGLMEFQKGIRGLQDELRDAVNSDIPNKPSSQYQEPADREEPTAPKFEPPGT